MLKNALKVTAEQVEELINQPEKELAEFIRDGLDKTFVLESGREQLIAT